MAELDVYELFEKITISISETTKAFERFVETWVAMFPDVDPAPSEGYSRNDGSTFSIPLSRFR